MAATNWRYTDVTWPASLSLGRAIALQAQLHLRNTLTLRHMWPYLLLIALPIAAAAGLARLSIHSDSAVIGRFYQQFAMRALPLGRLLAVTVLVAGLGVAMMAGSTVSLLGTLYSPDAGYVLRQVLAAGFGGFAYAGVYLALGAWFKAATALGLGFLVGVDLVAAPYWEVAGLIAPSHYIGVLVQTLPGRDLVAAATADQVPGALVGLAVVRMRGDVPG